jgi:hypothetical protein
MKRLSSLDARKAAPVLAVIAGFGVGVVVARATRSDDPASAAQAIASAPRLAAVEALPAVPAAKPEPKKKKPKPSSTTTTTPASVRAATPAPAPAAAPVPRVTTTVPVPAPSPVTPAPSDTGSFDDSG